MIIVVVVVVVVVVVAAGRRRAKGKTPQLSQPPCRTGDQPSYVVKNARLKF